MFLGSDILVDCAVLMGAQGVVPSISNVIGDWLVEAYDCAVAGQWERSRVLLERASDMKAMYAVATATSSNFDGFLAGLKGALELLGVEAGPPAAPIASLDADQQRTMEKLLRDGGVLAQI